MRQACFRPLMIVYLWIQDYQKMEFFEKYDATKKIPAGQDTEMPARLLNEELFPRLVEELTDPAVPYQPSSPFQGRWVNDPTIGDSHMWSESSQGLGSVC